MATTTFYRASFSTMTLQLAFSEALGLLDTDRIEDYNGNDGQVTMYHRDTAASYPVVMTHDAAQTPGTPFDVYVGPFTLTGRPSGIYEVRGRVRDTLGNYAILTAFGVASPGDVRELLVDIVDGSAIIQDVPIPAPMFAPSIPAPSSPAMIARLAGPVVNAKDSIR